MSMTSAMRPQPQRPKVKTSCLSESSRPWVHEAAVENRPHGRTVGPTGDTRGYRLTGMVGITGNSVQ
jgi:hypothetical protein